MDTLLVTLVVIAVVTSLVILNILALRRILRQGLDEYGPAEPGEEGFWKITPGRSV